MIDNLPPAGRLYINQILTKIIEFYLITPMSIYMLIYETKVFPKYRTRDSLSLGESFFIVYIIYVRKLLQLKKCRLTNKNFTLY